MTLAKIKYSTIEKEWDKIKEIVGKSLPEGFDVDLIKPYLKSNKLQLWNLFRDKEIVSVATTFIRRDEILNNRSLIIYTQFNFMELENGLMEVFYGGLKRYAKENRCGAVIRLLVEEVVE